MAVITKYIQLSTKGHADMVDITPEVNSLLGSLKIRNGIVNINACGSTGAITTIEYEPGLVQDIKDIFEQLIPAGHYNHDEAWGDGNGHSHLRSSIVGSSITMPFNDQALVLGAWQQIVFIDFDNRPRDRKIILQFIGE